MFYGYTLNNRYVIRQTLGSGGTSTVYLAYDYKLDKNWAVKKCATTQVNELTALKSINHYAFPRVVDICVQDGETFIVMDYIEGETLSYYLRHHHPGEKQILIWASKIASALSYLHNLNPSMIYMDLKPDNILITPSKDIRLVDLGSVFICSNSYVNKISGTKYYMLSDFSSDIVDINQDIYAFGMTLYELLNGSKTKYFDQHGNLNLRRRNKKISMFSEYIVRRCTERNKNKRYQSMNDIISDLKCHSELKKFRLIIKRNASLCMFKIADLTLKFFIGFLTVYNGLRYSSANMVHNLIIMLLLFFILLFLCSMKSTYSLETRKEVLRCQVLKTTIGIMSAFFAFPPILSHASTASLPLNVTLYDEFGRKLLVRSGYTLTTDSDLLFSVDIDEISTTPTTITISSNDKSYTVKCQKKE